MSCKELTNLLKDAEKVAKDRPSDRLSVQNKIEAELDQNRKALASLDAKYAAAVRKHASLPEPARGRAIFAELNWQNDPRPALRKEIACLEALLARAQRP